MLAKFTLTGNEIRIRRLTHEQVQILSVEGRHGVPVRDINRYGDCYSIAWKGESWEMEELIRELSWDPDPEMRELGSEWLSFYNEELQQFHSDKPQMLQIWQIEERESA